MQNKPRHRSLLADVAYRQTTSFALQTWSAASRPTLVFGGIWRKISLLESQQVQK